MVLGVYDKGLIHLLGKERVRNTSIDAVILWKKLLSDKELSVFLG